MKLYILFWGIYSIGIVLKLLAKKKGSKRIDNWSDFFLVYALLVLLLVIFSGDPFETPLPQEYQWLVTLFVAWISLWRLYLNPLKERVITIEKDFEGIKKDIHHIKEDVSKIKEYILYTKEKKKK
jgi:hypothetical protein